MKDLKLATVNNVSIIGLTGGEEMYVAIKPICEALGIASNGQIEKIKSDPLLRSTYKTVLSVGADNKQREMFSIPLIFVFGWLFRIDSRNVKEESREAVEKYQLECYYALAEHFSGPQEFLIKRDVVIDRETEEYERYKLEYAETKRKMNTAKSNLDKARSMTLYEWRLNKRQLGIPFDEKPEIEDAEAEAEN